MKGFKEQAEWELVRLDLVEERERPNIFIFINASLDSQNIRLEKVYHSDKKQDHLREAFKNPSYGKIPLRGRGVRGGTPLFR